MKDQVTVTFHLVNGHEVKVAMAQSEFRTIRNSIRTTNQGCSEFLRPDGTYDVVLWQHVVRIHAEGVQP